MAMTFDERAAVVQRLTLISRESPRLYSLRVVSWIVFGYLLIGVLLAVSLVLGLGALALIVMAKALIFLYVAWVPIGIAWMLARALFVRVDPPSGRRVLRREAPRLFAVVEEIRTRLGVGRLHDILLVADMNAAVVETPRLGGLLGWQRHLLIGLPLLLTHSREEMKAVLAHELGHLSARHGRLAARSWRVRVTWSRVLWSLDQRGDRIARMLRGLFHWYFDRLMVTTLVQARAQEHEADRFAVEATDAETAARALGWHCVASDLVEQRFWKPLWERVAEDPEPPRAPLTEFLRRREEILAPPYDEAFGDNLARTTSIDDTHPSLRERLASIGIDRPSMALPSRTAADDLLGRAAGRLVAECDSSWRQDVLAGWQERHRELAESRRIVVETEAAALETLDEARLHARAGSLSELGNEDDALAIYEELMRRSGSDAEAGFHVGRILVQRGDLTGIAHLARAMEQDWRVVVPACEIAWAALREKGMEKDAELWSERYRQQMEIIDEARAESYSLAASDDLAASPLPEETRQWIVARCREAGWVGKVWIARKNLRRLPTSVDFVAVRAKMFRLAGNRRFQKLVDALTTDDQLMFFLTEDVALMRRLDRIAGARVVI